MGIFFGILFYYAFTRIFLLWLFNDAGFGYDIGIYRRILVDYVQVGWFESNPLFAFAIPAKVLYFFGFSLDSILYGLYFTVALCVFALFYRIVEKGEGSETGIIAVLLLSTSIVQFDFFQWYYYRNLIAILFFLFSILLIQKKSHWISIPLIIIVSLHPLSAVLIFSTFFVYGLCKKEYRYYLIGHLLFSGIVAVGINITEFRRYIDIFYQSTGRIANVSPLLAGELDGQFITFFEYIKNSILYLPFGLIGFWKYKRKYLIFSILFLLSLLCIICKVLLYKRFYIFADFSILFFASIYFFSLYKDLKRDRWEKIPTILFVFYLGVSSLYHVYLFSPIISLEELNSIKSLEQQLPEESIIVSYSSVFAPWLLGFSGNNTIIAPGVFDANKWDFNTWQIFWSSKDVIERERIFDMYDAKEIYVFTGNEQTDILFFGDKHMIKLNPSLWIYRKSIN